MIVYLHVIKLKCDINTNYTIWQLCYKKANKFIIVIFVMFT